MMQPYRLMKLNSWIGKISIKAISIDFSYFYIIICNFGNLWIKRCKLFNKLWTALPIFLPILLLISFLLFHSNREDSDFIPTWNEVIIFIIVTYDDVSLILYINYAIKLICSYYLANTINTYTKIYSIIYNRRKYMLLVTV